MPVCPSFIRHVSPPPDNREAAIRAGYVLAFVPCPLLDVEVVQFGTTLSERSAKFVVNAFETRLGVYTHGKCVITRH